MVLGLVLMLSVVITATAGESVRISTADDREVQCTAFLPEGDEVVPCLVVAPGRGYHQGLPIFTDLARQAVAAGFAVLTFDWHYFSTNQAPSMGLTNEVEDLKAAITFARHHPRVDPSRVLIGGKSMGSVLAARVFDKDDSLAALVLLTPVMPTAEAGPQNYPGVIQETRPVLVVLGEGDAANCPLEVLYGVLAKAARRVPVVVVGGDHGLNIDSPENPLTASNISVANAAIVQWLRLWMMHSH